MPPRPPAGHPPAGRGASQCARNGGFAVCSISRKARRGKGLPLSVLFYRMTTIMDTHSALAQLEAAAAEGKLSAGAAGNIRVWLTEPYLAEYAPAVAEHLAAGRWQELDDAFWTTIPFGTGGRRGKMYPVGTNAINDRTIGESAQGLADYVKDQVRGKPLCLRHRLRHAAPLAAVRRTCARDHGGRRLPGVFPGRLPQHAGTLLRRALQALRLRHHHHGQPQPARRQCGEGLLVQRRPAPAAARRGVHRPRGEGHVRSGGSPLRRDCARARSSTARRKWMRPSSARC